MFNTFNASSGPLASLLQSVLPQHQNTNEINQSRVNAKALNNSFGYTDDSTWWLKYTVRSLVFWAQSTPEDSIRAEPKCTVNARTWRSITQMLYTWDLVVPDEKDSHNYKLTFFFRKEKLQNILKQGILKTSESIPQCSLTGNYSSLVVLLCTPKPSCPTCTHASLLSHSHWLARQLNT